jgi:flagellar hook-associated protein 3 FlgL
MIDMTNHMLYRVSNLNDESRRISYQMSTGEKLENGSDDSVLFAQVLNIKDNIRVYEGLNTQISKTIAQNIVSDSTVSEVKDSIDSLKADLLKTLNEGMDASAKSAIAVNIEGVRENLYTIINNRVDGEYIFSGSNTTKQTFVKDSNFDSNGRIDFGGDGILRQIAIEPNTYRSRGVTAYDVLMYNSSYADKDGQLSFYENEKIIDQDGQEWKLNGAKDKIQRYDRNGALISPAVEMNITSDGGTPPKYTTDVGEITGTQFLEAKHNFFDDLNVMINALKGYSTNSDGTKGALLTDEEIKDVIRVQLENTSNQYDATNIGHAELGGRNKIFEVAGESIEAKLTHYNIMLQDTNGADLSKLAMESKSLEMTYQALYSTISKMHSLSLLNFVK